MNSVRYLLVTAVLIFIFCNFRMTADYIVQGKKPDNSFNHLPGESFLFLRPYLSSVYRAGYFSDYTPADPDFEPRYAYFFQTAQFALAPTILDHEKPWSHDFVILRIFDPKSWVAIGHLLHYRVIAVSKGSDIVLIERVKT
jgi:hypothetical protein